MPIKLKTSLPGPKSLAMMAERQKQVARGPFHTTPLFVAKAKGSQLEDVDGNQLIDFTAGIGVVNVGHNNDSVVKAIKDQADKFLHTSFNVLAYESYTKLCEKLNKLAPGNFPKKTFLANSGAEAVENAIKIARTFTKRQAVVCFDHAFHGRTYLAMTLTSKSKPYKYGFGPLNSEVYRAPYPYAYRWPTTSDPVRVAEEAFAAFENVANNQIGATQIAAVILEPVLGEGGFVPAPKEFMRKLRDFCTANGIVLICDEVQTGFGRTGTLFASEQMDMAPDLITMAKGLGGGMPLSAVTGRAEIMDAPMEGGIGGTFGGHPLSCASALAVIELMENSDVLAKAKSLATSLGKRLADFKEKYPVIGDVRGLGPMQAIEFVKNRTTKEPAPEMAKKLQAYCWQKGLITMTSGTYGNVLRLLMPLVIDEADLREGLDVIEAGLKDLV
jgi:4-aminobutyrate aminotransferase / (S)-3-amino-2-methylpropionate transaminase / 5-aminovalerate transaminase